MSTLTVLPQSTLLPDWLLQFCEQEPTQTFCCIVNADKYPIQCVSKTRMELLKDATSAAARFQRCGLGKRQPGEPPVVVSILARSGYNSFITFLGVMFNRWTPVMISTRVSVGAVIQLVRSSNSRLLLVDEDNANTLSTVHGILPSLICYTAELQTPNAGSADPIVSWFWSAEQRLVERDTPAFYLHTSGSVAAPKLIPLMHRQWEQAVNRMTPYPGRPMICPLPVFHTSGLAPLIKASFGSGNIPVIIESYRPINAAAFCEVLDQFPGAISVLPPSLLEDIAHSPAHIQTLASSHRVFFVGAALPKQIGDDLVRSGVKLASAFGSTETDHLTVIDLVSDDPLDWQYVRFLDSADILLVPIQESNGLHRLVIKAGNIVKKQLINCDDPIGFETGDLWQEHPTKRDIWKHMGRNGSITVLSNGEKTDNDHLESLMIENPLIQCAIVFGEGRFQSGIILWPSEPDRDPSDILRAVWPTVEHANSIVPQHSRLLKELVLVANPPKPFVFTDKLTLNRQQTLALYAHEIQTAYANLEAGVAFKAALPDREDKEEILAYIHSVVKHLLGKDVSDDVDLFDNGIDSLLALSCRSYLIPLSRSILGSDRLPRNLLYHHPTIRSLFTFITSTQISPDNNGSRSRLSNLLDIALSSMDLASPLLIEATSVPFNDNTGMVVLLTGSTGTFGSHILTTLAQSSAFSKVYCLNRQSNAVSAMTRQLANLEDSNVLDMYASKLVLLEGELHREDFGLEFELLNEIRNNVTHIIHCAWEVNFNHQVDRFLNEHIKGVRNIANLSITSGRRSLPRILFISSVSAVANFVGAEHGIPEVPLSDLSLPLDQGYAQSKFIAERMLIHASKVRGVPVTIIRVGQLSGSSMTGVWNRNEHIPILLRSCMMLGMVPESIPNARWTPVDIAAQVVHDIVANDPEQTSSSLLIRHIDNVQVIPGTVIIDKIVEASVGSVHQAATDTWLQAIRETSTMSIPAQKLLDFYETFLREQGDLRLDTKHTSSISAAFGRAVITSELIEKYVQSSVAEVVI